MIDLIQKQEDGTVEWWKDGKTVQSFDSLPRVLSRWTQSGLSTVEGRILAVKRQFSLKTRIPLYIDEGLLLMPIRPIRSPDAFLVNYHAVCSWRALPSGNAEVLLSEGKAIVVKSARSFRKLMSASLAIEEFFRGRTSVKKMLT